MHECVGPSVNVWIVSVRFTQDAEFGVGIIVLAIPFGIHNCYHTIPKANGHQNVPIPIAIVPPQDNWTIPSQLIHDEWQQMPPNAELVVS
ncbi:MAG: hypothetical protein JWQ98_359 [Chlorobi bacterium]|nr:hypothetical protein [Chlorobiota bacterium]